LLPDFRGKLDAERFHRFHKNNDDVRGRRRFCSSAAAFAGIKTPSACVREGGGGRPPGLRRGTSGIRRRLLLLGQLTASG
jgi:hypothetical protein